MEIDNIDRILPFIVPESEDDFYFLQILKRKKENPELGSNSVVIRNYYIKSQEHLLKRYNEIKDICRATNSRAMITLNKKSFYNVAFKTFENMSHCMMNKDFTNISNQYDKAIGQTNADNKKKWIVDIDTKDTDFKEELTAYVYALEPLGAKQLAFIPSKAGCHLISKPFNMQKFSEKYPDVDVQKNNPTNLFIP